MIDCVNNIITPPEQTYCMLLFKGQEEIISNVGGGEKEEEMLVKGKERRAREQNTCSG